MVFFNFWFYVFGRFRGPHFLICMDYRLDGDCESLESICLEASVHNISTSSHEDGADEKGGDADGVPDLSVIQLSSDENESR